MGLARRLLEGAVSKMDELGDRVQESNLAKLTPAERERYDAWQARTAAAGAGAPVEELGDPRLTGAVLQGHAGEVMHGVTKLPNGRHAIDDPQAWDVQMRAERAARDEVRRAYLAPGRHPVRISRVATVGKTQAREVAEYLGSSGLAARPDLVYGAYRVPDAISPGRLGGEQGGIVEWDVVHAAEGPLDPAAPPGVVSLDAKDVWVLRAPGDRSPLDEDLALDILARAHVGPEHTLAIARGVAIAQTGGSHDSSKPRIAATVQGVHLLVAAEAHGAVSDATGGAPWQLREGPPDGVYLDILQWEALAKAVHPVRQYRAPLPSPFPYLPLTPQELLRAYLEVVGVAPADAYAAQVTHDRPFDLMARTSRHSGVRRTGGGPELPCADGKPRERMAGGHHVVVAYRDRPEYAEGRERFDAYAETELHAHLRRGLGLRAPVPKPSGRLMRAIDGVADFVEAFSDNAGTEDGFNPPRYCWPPQAP